MPFKEILDWYKNEMFLETFLMISFLGYTIFQNYFFIPNSRLTMQFASMSGTIFLQKNVPND